MQTKDEPERGCNSIILFYLTDERTRMEQVALSLWICACTWPGTPPVYWRLGRSTCVRATVMPSTPSSWSTLLGSTKGLQGFRQG